MYTLHGNRNDVTNSQTSRRVPDLENLTVSQVSPLSQASLWRQTEQPKIWEDRTIEEWCCCSNSKGKPWTLRSLCFRGAKGKAILSSDPVSCSPQTLYHHVPGESKWLCWYRGGVFRSSRCTHTNILSRSLCYSIISSVILRTVSETVSQHITAFCVKTCMWLLQIRKAWGHCLTQILTTLYPMWHQVSRLNTFKNSDPWLHKIISSLLW